MALAMRPSAGSLVRCAGMLGFVVLVWAAYNGFSATESQPRRIGVGGPFHLIDQNGHAATYRDTPAVMKDYDASFSPSLVGLSGTASEIATVEREFPVTARRHPTADGGYDFDHSSGIFLLDQKGEFAGFFEGDADPDAMARRISAIMARGGP